MCDVCVVEDTNVDSDFWTLVEKTWGVALPNMRLSVYRRRTGKVGVDAYGEPTQDYEEWWALYTARGISWFEAQGKSVAEMAVHTSRMLAREAV